MKNFVALLNSKLSILMLFAIIALNCAPNLNKLQTFSEKLPNYYNNKKLVLKGKTDFFDKSIPPKYTLSSAHIENICSQYPDLEELRIIDWQFLNANWSPLKKLTKLKKLQISSFCYGTFKLNNTFSEALSNLTQLESLRLNECKIIEFESTSFLSKLENLKELYLFDLKVSRTSFINQLGLLSNLEKLEIKVSEEDSKIAASEISKLRNLKYLILDADAVDTPNLHELHKLDSLEIKIYSKHSNAYKIIENIKNLSYLKINLRQRDLMIFELPSSLKNYHIDIKYDNKFFESSTVGLLSGIKNLNNLESIHIRYCYTISMRYPEVTYVKIKDFHKSLNQKIKSMKISKNPIKVTYETYELNNWDKPTFYEFIL